MLFRHFPYKVKKCRQEEIKNFENNQTKKNGEKYKKEIIKKC